MILLIEIFIYFDLANGISNIKLISDY